jgi:hypothetical protein
MRRSQEIAANAFAKEYLGWGWIEITNTTMVEATNRAKSAAYMGTAPSGNNTLPMLQSNYSEAGL